MTFFDLIGHQLRIVLFVFFLVEQLEHQVVRWKGHFETKDRVGLIVN